MSSRRFGPQGTFALGVFAEHGFIIAVKIDHPHSGGEGFVLWPDLASSGEGFEQVASSVLGIAPVEVLALVGFG